MRGSVNYQINQIFVQSGIFQPGTSKHTDKISAKDSLPKGQQTASNVAQQTNIHSFKYAEDCKDTWHKLGHYARQEHGLKDMTQLSDRHVQSFLEKKIDDVTKYDSWNKIASHVNKLENALRDFTQKEHDLRHVTDRVRDVAKSELDRSEPPVKGYENPKSVIDNIKNEDAQLTAKLQLEGGCRREEAVQVKNEQLKGLADDPATGGRKGVVELTDTKGGKEREIYISPRTYAQLEERTQNDTFKISENSYSKHVQEAAAEAGESQSGTHDFRYNFAAERYNQCVEHGLNNEQALQQTSWELGHERADITLHYLR